MNKEFSVIDLDVHFYLNEEQKHQMDAIVLNKCQLQLLKALQHMAQYTGDCIRIEACALEPGGVISSLQVIFNKDTILGATLLLLLSGSVNRFFNKEQNALENIDKRIEILKKLKSGNISAEEAKILVESDETLHKCVSSFYKDAQKEPSIVSIESSIKSVDEGGNHVLSKIERADFDRKIIPDGKTKTSETITSTTVAVISPVFAHDIKLKWHCRFNGEQIVAEIRDDDFITQVNNFEVKFDAGTTLKCDLVVETTSFPDRLDKKPTKHYYITNVWEWADGSHVVFTTKRYRALNKE